MTDRTSRKSQPIGNHVVGGRGTHNRPWIIEDDGASNDRVATSATRSRNQSLSTSEHGTGEATHHHSGVTSRSTTTASGSNSSTTGSRDRTKSYIRRSTGLSSHEDAQARRASSSDIRTAGSGDSGSSYDRYLAQKRANQEKPPPPQTAAAAPVSPVLEKHYTNDGKAILLASSRRDAGVHGRRRITGIIPTEATTTSDDALQRNGATSSSSSSTQPFTTSNIASHHRFRRSTSSNTEMDNDEDKQGSNITSSRDLRARRLAASQQSRAPGPSQSDPPSTIAQSSQSATTTLPLHFQAHDAAVEKYLMRSRISTDPGRSRTTSLARSHILNNRQMDVPPLRHDAPPDAAPRLPTSSTISSRARSDGATSIATPLPASSRTSHHQAHNNMAHGHRGNTSATQTVTSHSKHVGAVISETTTSPSMNGANDTTLPTGWSTRKAASTTGYHNVTTEAIAAHDAYRADTSRATIPVVPVGSGSHKVDEYLAQRNALKAKVESFSRIGKKRPDEVDCTVDKVTPPIVSVPSTSVSLEDSADDESEEGVSDVEIDDNEDDNKNTVVDDDEYMEDHAHLDPQKEWSVKVCVISAVDFPASVVPNLPFSPMLKLGLIKVDSAVTTDQDYRELAKGIEINGLSTIPQSRVRCTSSKILSKRENGSVEFHEEVRWNRVEDPHCTALALELSSRAVLQPANFRESPQQQKIGPFLLSPTIPSNNIRPNGSVKKSAGRDTTTSVIGSMFRNIRKTDSAEMEEANAAAAVAKHLVRGEVSESSTSQTRPYQQSKNENQSEIDVRLRRRKDSKRVKMSEEVRIGSKVIPLSCLSLNNAMQRHETVRIEQWFELDTCANPVKTSLVGTSPSLSTATRNPSILLEISFSARDVLDESEDEMDESDSKIELKASYSKRAALKIRKQLKQEVKPRIEKAAEPVLEPGIIDFISIVGAKDIGDQKNDDGSSGWVDSTPDCCILEQFPPNDEFHTKRGRNAVLAGKIEWFCFPEGCKLWRGLTPPNHDELHLKRFSASTSGNIASSIASFDASLGCTTSFSWFVIASSSDKYGSENKKTYCAVIRFFVPAPPGIDPTQDDFAQTYVGNATSTGSHADQNNVKRLWVPIGICMTSSLPIVGTMEVMLLRLCESLSTLGYDSSARFSEEMKTVREALLCTIVSYQKPIPGVVNCSFPFLKGEPLHIAIPARTGLPPLPHGSSVSAVCRLLGADGLNFLLAAFLTECKILLHSDDVANLSMVAEVLSALIYPFEWALPYVPILPVEMMEFIEAPVSFLIGVPTCNMCNADPNVLEDVVVVDLDRDFATSDYFEGRRNGMKTKSPIPLPAAVASNIAKACHRLIKTDDDSEGAMGQSLPRLKPETLAEKEFRVAVALEVCGLIRGFDECLVFSSSQPVFNVDKFLQIAPSIFEEQRDTNRDHGSTGSRNVISPRSRRFVSSLVCCQHFHQFLDVLETETLTFFHVIMRTLHTSRSKKEKSLGGMLLALESNQGTTDLCKMLNNAEEKTPTYRVKSLSGQWGTIVESHAIDEIKSSISNFPINLLQQINIHENSQMKDSGQDGVKSVSVEYLVELEKTPWKYRNLFNFRTDLGTVESSFPVVEKVKLREAIGDRRYKAWKAGYDKFDGEDGTIISEDTLGLPNALDLRNLLAAAAADTVRLNESNIDDAAALNAKHRETIRRCLECSKRDSSEFHDLLEGAEIALQNPASKQFILSILSQRTRKDVPKNNDTTTMRRRSLQYGGSKIDADLFDLLVRLSFAMLDSCDTTNDYESAYQLLKYTAGLYAAINDGGTEINVVYVTERIGLHPIYGNLSLWESVKATHSAPQQNGKPASILQNDSNVEGVDDEYEAAVATLYEMNGYGIPVKDLAQFASRLCHINGWFHSEKGQTILMLAKRFCLRRDSGSVVTIPSALSDLALISMSPRKSPKDTHRYMSNSISGEFKWIEIGWCHPAAQSSRRNDANRRAGQNTHVQIEDDVKELQSDHQNSKSMKRSAVTSMVYLGSSVCVTGGLDGGVFLARTVRSGTTKESSDGTVGLECAIRGLHLDWGSSGSRYAVGSATTTMDGEYGVGAVTCLTATQSTICGTNPNAFRKSTKDIFDLPKEDEQVLEAMNGCRVVAGTTCGDLRVWSIKDVFTAVFYANRSSIDAESASTASSNLAVRSSQGQSKSTDFAAGSSLTRLKFSLRGRALSGHRGGVSCIIVHSNVYRPDSIVSGGADGLIKLWSLRTPGTSGGRRSSVDPGTASSSMTSSLQYRSATGSSSGAKGASTGDALSILSGHGGRILCIKTAWHGDRLLSGGADRTVRLWDLASGSGGKCLNTLSGHFGWVTNVEFWGQNTIISASTDRSIGLWDVRVGNSPLFMLRHHYSPLSNLLLEPHCDATLVSSATDGSVASWDLRQLNVVNALSNHGTHPKNQVTRIVRSPTAIIKAQQQSFRRPELSLGPVYLTKGTSPNRRTVHCLGGDTIVREWDYKKGEVLQESTSGHCDTISGFVALANDKVLGSQLESVGLDNTDATLSASWDGTVRLRNRIVM